MIIRIKVNSHKIILPLPTGLIFSKGTARLGNHFGRKYAPDAFENIQPEALDAMFAEFRRIKKQYGRWELADIESADGERIIITL